MNIRTCLDETIRSKDTIKWVKRHLKELEKGNVLSIGCGEKAILLKEYAQTFPALNFFGIDLEAKDSSKNNLKVLGRNFFKWDSKTKFDVVIASDFIHHVPKQNQAFKRISGLTTKDGLFLLKDIEKNRSKMMFLINKWIYDFGHFGLKYLSEKNLRTLLEKNNFKVEEIVRFNRGFVPHIGFKSRKK